MKVAKQSRARPIPAQTTASEPSGCAQALIDSSPRQQMQVGKLMQLKQNLASGQQAIIQRVGGSKYGFKKDEEADVEEVLLLQQEIDRYKNSLKQKKANAVSAFQGKEDNKDAQSNFSAALKNASWNLNEFSQFIQEHFDVSDNLITSKNSKRKVATLVQGDDAYVQHTAAEKEGHSAVYKRVGLNGPGEKDYIKTGRGYLRRFAYRGLTPDEELGNAENRDILRPYNHAYLSTGKKKANSDWSTKTMKAAKNSDSDLTWLKEKSNNPGLASIPASSLEFLQHRKNANKLFSASSTAKNITSNQGDAFTEGGRFKLDLSKVPLNDILDQYTESGNASIQHGLSAEQIGVGGQAKLEEEIKRAKESAIRNREIHLRAYPRSAIVEHEK